MKILFIFLLFTSVTFGQEKLILYYNEDGREMTRQEFENVIDYRKNLNLL